MGRFIEMRDKLVGHLIGKPVGQRPKPSPFSSGIGFEGSGGDTPKNPFTHLRDPNKPIPKDSGIGFDERKNPMNFRPTK